MSTLIEHLRRRILLQDGAALTDQELLTAFIEQRDEAAFALLVRRHGPMVWSVCRRMLGNIHDAEDAFQAAFLVLIRKAGSIAPRNMVGNWLHGVACHTALKAKALGLRRKRREKQVHDIPDQESPAERTAHDWQPVLDEELSRLPHKYKAPVILCDLQGKTRKEAAQQLGWPEGTVSWRLAKGRDLLARKLTRRGVSLSGQFLAVVLAENTASAAASAVCVTIPLSGWSAVGNCAVSTPVAALVKGVLKTMFLTKLKLAVAACLVVAAFGVGGAMTLGHVLTARAADDTDPKQQISPEERRIKILQQEIKELQEKQRKTAAKELTDAEFSGKPAST